MISGAEEMCGRTDNTVEIDGADSTEVWGTFRAARRARPHLEQAATGANEDVVIVASHDGYRRLKGSPVHRRTWRVGDDNFDVTDEVTGGGQHAVTARLHVHGPVAASAHRVTIGPLCGEITGGDVSIVEAGTEPGGLVGSDFGVYAPASCVEVTAQGALPLRLTISAFALPEGDGSV